MEEKGLWDKMLGAMGGGSEPAKAEPVKKSYKNHPGYMKAQREALQHYMKTGEDKPLESFLDKP